LRVTLQRVAAERRVDQLPLAVAQLDDRNVAVGCRVGGVMPAAQRAHGDSHGAQRDGGHIEAGTGERRIATAGRLHKCIVSAPRRRRPDRAVG
jgi:hypothetical protein